MLNIKPALFTLPVALHTYLLTPPVPLLQLAHKIVQPFAILFPSSHVAGASTLLTSGLPVLAALASAPAGAQMGAGGDDSKRGLSLLMGAERGAGGDEGRRGSSLMMGAAMSMGDSESRNKAGACLGGVPSLGGGESRNRAGAYSGAALDVGGSDGGMGATGAGGGGSESGAPEGRVQGGAKGSPIAVSMLETAQSWPLLAVGVVFNQDW